MAEFNLRATACNGIKRIWERLSNMDLSTCDAPHLNQDLKAVEAHYDRFFSNHQILVGKAKTDELDTHEKLWDQVETMFNQICITLERRLLQLKYETKLERECSSASNFDMRLDRVTVPSFDGSLRDWLAFKDTFETLVHNTEYPEAYKLNKLRQAVDATKVPFVDGMYSGGYAEVWQALKDRFDNPKLLAEVHVSRFINIKPESEDSARALLSIVDTVHESLRALRVMKLPVDQWDALATPIVVWKLPLITQREWCMHCSSNEIPRLSDLLEFLEKRAHSLSTSLVNIPGRSDSSTERHQRQTQRLVKSHVATVGEGKCIHCQGPHRISRCQTVLSMKPEQRFELLKHSGLCFNCLKHGHCSRQCPAGGCHQCGRKHHTLFCRQPQSTPAPAIQTIGTLGRSSQPAVSSLIAQQTA